MMISPSGGAGIVVQTNGELAGYLYDFFISPRERARVAYDFLLLAIHAGANKVATYDHPLVTSYFELFGFQAIAIAMSPRAQRKVVHMMLLDEAFSAREARLHEVGTMLDSRCTDTESETQPAACVFCGHELPALTIVSDIFGGYTCPRCRFMRLYGTLTLGPPEPPLGPRRIG